MKKNIPSNQPAGSMAGSGNPLKPILAAVFIVLIAGTVFFIAGSGKQAGKPALPEIETPDVPDLAVPDLDEPQNAVPGKTPEAEPVAEIPDPAADEKITGGKAFCLWVEGESAVESSVSPHPWWYDKVVKSEFSEEGWISNWSDKAGTARYSIDIPADGSYSLWLRANPKDSHLSYKIDGGLWKSVNMKNLGGPIVNIAEAGKQDMRYIAWIDAGNITLIKGKQSFEVKFHSANNNHGILDCFVITAQEFKPDGKNRPGG